MRPIPILLVVPNRLDRACLGAWLAAQPELSLVAEAADGPEAIRESRALATPHIVVTEICLPGWSGIELTDRLQSLPRRPRVVAFSAYRDPGVLSQLADAGAFCHVHSSEPLESLLAAVRNASRAPHPRPRAAGNARPSESAAESPPEARTARRLGLTNREAQLLQCLLLGMGNREIADHLKISLRTVQTHFQRVYSKLRVHNRTDAMMTALRTCQILEPVESPPELRHVLHTLRRPA